LPALEFSSNGQNDTAQVIHCFNVSLTFCLCILLLGEFHSVQFGLPTMFNCIIVTFSSFFHFSSPCIDDGILDFWIHLVEKSKVMLYDYFISVFIILFLPPYQSGMISIPIAKIIETMVNENHLK
jgi:hypothetical protein